MLPNAVDSSSSPGSPWTRAKSPDLSDPFAEITRRLDQLSEKMDRCLAEVAGAPAGPKAPSASASSSFRSRLAIVPEPARPELAAFQTTAPSARNSVARSSHISARPRPSGMSTITGTFSNANARFSDARTSFAARLTSRTSLYRPRETISSHSVPYNERGQPEVLTRRELIRRLNLPGGQQKNRRANGVWATKSDKSDIVEEWLTRRSRLDRLWEVLDEPHSSWLAWGVSMFMRLTVVLSLAVTLLQTSQEDSFLDAPAAAILETVIDSIFVVEFLCRLISAPSKTTYFRDLYNWADMAASCGLVFRASIGFVIDTSGPLNAVEGFLLFWLPVVRFLKLLRYFDSLKLLVDAAANSLEALPVLLYTMVLIVLASATVIYLVEVRSDIPSLAHAVWLAIVTMTTVGYGDYAPKTPLGYIFVSVLTTVSVLFFALPVGIIGHEFTAAWQIRRQVLLFDRVQKCFLKWGYGGEDMQALFEFADADGDGMLNLLEFCQLLRELKLGLDTESLFDLFMMIDDKQEGLIEFSVLLRRVFPEFQAETPGEDDSDLD